MAQIPAHIRFFLTGRPDVPSYLKFDKLLSLMHRVVLDEIEPRIVQHDIHLYVKQSLDGANWITRDPWKIQSQQAEEITTRANGLFVLQLQLFVMFLQDCRRHPPRNLLITSWMVKVSLTCMVYTSRL
jgi:hypothetical protein